jgi:hypothetical protein
MDMKFGFGLWKVMTVSRELSKYKSDLVGVQKFGWEGGVTELA